MNESKPSKSARKREQQALQRLGEQLIELQEDDILQLGLDEGLADAVLAAKGMKSHGALRRQRQLIGKLMRNVDADPIRELIARVNARGQGDKRVFAQAEKWRDRIVDEGREAIEAFRDCSGTTDDELDQLIAELGRAATEKARKTTKRKIFRAINKVLVATQQDDRISQ